VKEIRFLSPLITDHFFIQVCSRHFNKNYYLRTACGGSHNCRSTATSGWSDQIWFLLAKMGQTTSACIQGIPKVSPTPRPQHHPERAMILFMQFERCWLLPLMSVVVYLHCSQGYMTQRSERIGIIGTGAQDCRSLYKRIATTVKARNRYSLWAWIICCLPSTFLVSSGIRYCQLLAALQGAPYSWHVGSCLADSWRQLLLWKMR